MTTQPKIVLFDLHPENGAGRSLLYMLESSSRLDIQLELKLLDEHASISWETEISGLLTQLRPNIIFLLCPNRLEKLKPFIAAIRKETEAPLIVVTETRGAEEMFELLKLGATDFIGLPLKTGDILPRVWRLLEQAGQEKTLTQTLKERLGLKQLIGESPAFLHEVEKIPLLANCDASVLITGETGTGKEVCARAIHYLSPRASKPFVPVNCGAIPLELVENELFGHERGAYTGALTSELGLINEADGGTLFLDEVDCLPLLAQVKLLRFLQEKEYRPLGSSKVCKANVRLMAATNIDLEKAVDEGIVRRDLYYRLNVIPLKLPTLRERREDIMLLATHFLAKYRNEFNKEVSDFSAEAIQALMRYAWPGNVRELEHVIERAVVLCERKRVSERDVVLPESIPIKHESFQQMKARVVAQFEKTYIQEVLTACNGNITRAAQMALKNRRAFWQLIRKYRINVQAFKTIL